MGHITDPPWVSAALIDDEGQLLVAEAERHIPFPIKRLFVISGVTSGRRGFHAHKKTRQVLFCLSGSVSIILDDGENRKTHRIDIRGKGVLIDAMVWNELVEFAPNTTLLVVASEYFLEHDYIRDYQDFLALKKNTHAQVAGV